MTGFIYSGQGELFGERRAVGFGDNEFSVREVQRGLANAIIQRNHYSGKFYSATYIHLGVFMHGELVGILQFGYAMNPASQGGVVAGTAIDEYLELNRMWLDDAAPRNSESRALSSAIKLIRTAYPKIKWIQSFADERCRLGGVVYQACNFRYFGEHTSTFWELDGQVYHNSLMTRDRKLSKAAAIIQDGKDRATSHHLRQFRYIYFMKPRFAKSCVLTEHPFPKLYAARPEDERVSNPCEAGATPAGRSKDKAAA